MQGCNALFVGSTGNGDAIDFIVFDINNDGRSYSKDVDIVFEIFDKEIIKKFWVGLALIKMKDHLLTGK